MRLAILLIILLLVTIPSIAQAAVIRGSVYDLLLQKTKDVILEIDTTPNQQIVSKTGDYNFTVSNGQYTIAAKKLVGGRPVANSSEKITVNGDGEFNLDIIILPIVDDLGISNDDLVLQLEEKKNGSGFIFWVLGLLVLMVFLIFIFENRLKSKKINKIGKNEVVMDKKIIVEAKKPEAGKLPQDLEKMLEVIRREGGRINQLDLRKEFNLSEAKISLMVADLESRGLVKKIKKGRGNIVILN